jgi:hypothetical protein
VECLSLIRVLIPTRIFAGDTMPEIMNCKERGLLLGGMTSVTLSDGAAAQRADRRKTVQKRLREPVFQTVLELHERERCARTASN